VSYQDFEGSAYQGEPVELYRFTLGVDVFAYTSADEDVTHSGTLYEAEPGLQRSQVEVSEELARQGLTVEVPRDNDLAALWLASPPMVAAELQLLRGHRNDPDAEFVTYWRGRVAKVSWSGSRAVITCENALSGLRRMVFVPNWSRGCRHGLYAQGCEVAQTGFAVTGTVTAVNGAVVTAAAWAGQPDGWFTGGFVELLNTPLRMVVDHVGDALTLQAAVPGVRVGDELVAYAGCDHTSETCETKFGNLDNFGGCEFFPEQNPFDGKVV